jgi:hypothetical protein
LKQRVFRVARSSARNESALRASPKRNFRVRRRRHGLAAVATTAGIGTSLEIDIPLMPLIPTTPFGKSAGKLLAETLKAHMATSTARERITAFSRTFSYRASRIRWGYS